jgi:uncharacterized protein (TIGR02421 family)
MVNNQEAIDSDMKYMNSIFRFYNWLFPVNLDAEVRKFRRNPESYNPYFIYRYDKSDLNKAQSIVSSMESPDGFAGDLYTDLKEEYLEKIKMIRSIGDNLVFTERSLKIYGLMDETDKKFCENVLNSTDDVDYLESVPARDIRTGLMDMIAEKGITGWKVVLKENIPSKVTVKPHEKKIYVKSNNLFFAKSLERLKIHEIAVHLFRSVNGERQPYGVFSTGLAGYLEAEEGLAVYYENMLKAGNPRQMKIYAGRYKAVELAISESFTRTYSMLRKWFPEEMALRLTFRAKRGITDTSKPGALTKDIHYISGYNKIKNILTASDRSDELFCGKIGLQYIDMVSDMLSRGMLTKPGYKPC